MITTNDFCKNEYGEKLYKLSIDAGFSCPNRDGNLGTRGCIFCSEGGSGDFAESRLIPVDEQIERAKSRVASKFKGSKYIAYFQAFTNTYGTLDYLKSIYEPVAARDDIAVISIATRPDCLDDSKIYFLKELNQIKPVWIELGLQTIKPESVEYIRRGYNNEVYDEVIGKFNAAGIHTITHVIVGLPGETKEDVLNTVKHVVEMGSKGIKLQLLHVLNNTDLAEDFLTGKFNTLSMEEYIDWVLDALRILPKDMVVHRITGDGPKKLLISPTWSGDKKRVMNAMNKAIRDAGL